MFHECSIFAAAGIRQRFARCVEVFRKNVLSDSEEQCHLKQQPAHLKSALRLHRAQDSSSSRHAAHHPSIMQTQPFRSLQQAFHTQVVAHASAEQHAATPDAAAGAQQWLRAVEQAAHIADVSGKRQLAGQLVLIMYYGLFDAGKQSSALADVNPR